MYRERAGRLFLETGVRFPARVVWAVGLLKYAAARVNGELGLLERDVAEAVARAARAVMERGQVEVDVFQTGSGTGLNMAVNEAIAEEASRILGRPVHPNDHVNLGQSSNDVVPSAVRIAAVAEYAELRGAVEELIAALGDRGEAFRGLVKPGRTHLRDALPVTLGQELGGHADVLRRGLAVLEAAVEAAKGLPIGGTAVGTGLNTHPEFGRRVVEVVNAETGLGFRQANPFAGMKSLTDLLSVSGALRTLAVDLMRLCQDLRLMFSGPATGLGEIDLPTQWEVPGSSMMPGKANPVTVEAAMLAAAQVVGLDQANQVAAGLGELELAMGVPLMGHNLVVQMRLLAEAMRKVARLAVRPMEPNAERMRRMAAASPALATLLAPVIGYERAGQVARQLTQGKALEEVLREMGLEAVKLEDLTKPGFPLKRVQPS